jgi:cell division protein FtsW (lipid II flippase)/cell division protein FtsI/penicillin-binding protein 2
MAVTKSWEAAVASRLDFEGKAKAPERGREFWALLGATLLVAAGLVLVYTAKTQDFPALQQRLDSGDLLDINSATKPADISKILLVFTDPEERAYAAERVWEFLQLNHAIPNAGTLSRIRIRKSDTLNDSRARAIWERETAHAKTPPTSVQLFAVSRVKPFIVVRTPKEFLRLYVIWGSTYLLAFWLVHILWRIRRFRGDPTILPALLMLSGIGFILMVSLRDPLRDTLEFRKFAWGCVGGCILLLLPLLRAFQYRVFARWIYTPLFVAVGLFVSLLVLGSGPTGSDAKVNLGPFQPVELIKILIVLFLAGYFAANWERLRDLRQKSFVPKSLRGLEIPRIDHTLPVMLGVAVPLGLFFVLKDMGPALVIGMVFMTVFAVARGRAGLPMIGVAALVIGVALGVHFGAPKTVVERVDMWLSPWDNKVHGGDQLAHSLWAFATGGPIGSGPGWGDPSLIPAGHTDLVLASIAEEWGLPGVVCVCALFGVLLMAAFRIALKAPDEYATFLGVGLGTLIAYEMLLVSGGALGAIPLSGVVSPFLSSGNTAMLSNFLIFALLLGISNQSVQPQVALTRESGMPNALEVDSLEPAFRVPVRLVSLTLGICALLLLGRAIYIQVFHDRELLSKETFVYAQDGVRRFQRNPRLNLLAAEIPRGTIYDRNGVILATSSWADLDKRRADFQKLGVEVDSFPRLDSRFYPFGAATVHLLGDWRTHENFVGENSSLIERDSNPRLQGFTDFAELAPVVRVRHQRDNPVLQELLNRKRDVQSTIDVRLQLKANEILQKRLQPTGLRGAIVVMNAQSGDVVALATYPLPPPNGPGNKVTLLDRARYGEYPPGSTFKLVTAIAALRLNPRATDNVYKCTALGDGRVGAIIPGWRRPIRDDVGDHAHGTLNMANAIAVSCNAYFAQLGVEAVGEQALHDTAGMLGISTGTLKQVKEALPFAAYGQGTVLTTPFKMARVAATIAAGGQMPEGRWVTDPSNSRTDKPVAICAGDSAAFLQRAMRSVVTSGTARASMTGIKYEVAGKTGTAQLDEGDPHSWFAGFAPYSSPPDQRLAFAVVVEHGGYGAKFAAPIARELVEAAGDLKLIVPMQGK